MEIRIYNYQDGVTKLGPGIRFILWTQGCARCCKGCMTPMSQDRDSGRIISVFDLADIIIQSGRDGLTISGGEPFLQAQALYELVNLIRAKRDIGIIVYTGYTLDEILQSKDLYMCRFLEQIDLLIDGPYIEELNDGMNLRGSSNQRAIALTARYESDVDGYGSKKAEVEFFMKEDKVLMVGVPDSNTLTSVKIGLIKQELIGEMRAKQKI